jgi:hypothetical protein
MEDIFESLRTMKWDFEEIKRNSNKHYNFVTYGVDNPMFGLKGENHPSHHWHKNVATQENYDRISKGVKESWVKSDSRKKKHSESMKDKWSSGKITTEQARKNGSHGMKGKQIHNTLDIEYKGVIYYGWRELLEKTKVTKHLYKKYYLNGMDPEPRIGCDGPNPNLNMNKIEKEVSE